MNIWILLKFIVKKSRGVGSVLADFNAKNPPSQQNVGS
jgi:hypothetical protein